MQEVIATFERKAAGRRTWTNLVVALRQVFEPHYCNDNLCGFNGSTQDYCVARLFSERVQSAPLPDTLLAITPERELEAYEQLHAFVAGIITTFSESRPAFALNTPIEGVNEALLSDVRLFWFRSFGVFQRVADNAAIAKRLADFSVDVYDEKTNRPLYEAAVLAVLGSGGISDESFVQFAVRFGMRNLSANLRLFCTVKNGAVQLARWFKPNETRADVENMASGLRRGDHMHFCVRFGSESPFTFSRWTAELGFRHFKISVSHADGGGALSYWFEEEPGVYYATMVDLVLSILLRYSNGNPMDVPVTEYAEVMEGRRLWAELDRSAR